MASDTLHLWFAYPDDFNEESVIERFLALLSEGERRKLGLFKFDSSRREYLAAHALLRTALSHCAPVAPEAWRFRSNDHGRPFIDPPCDLSFSLSRRRGLVACLVSQRHEVGIDIESPERSSEILEIANRVFSAKELAQLDRVSIEKKRDHALSLWTLKEAYCKARGMGLSLPLQQFSFLRGPSEDMLLEVDSSIGGDAARWQFALIDHAAHRVALMIERQPEPRLEARLLRPFQAPSCVPTNPRQLWFPLARE